MAAEGVVVVVVVVGGGGGGAAAAARIVVVVVVVVVVVLAAAAAAVVVLLARVPAILARRLRFRRGTEQAEGNELMAEDCANLSQITEPGTNVAGF